MTTPRIEKLTQMIADYADDSYMDGYHTGYDEAYEEQCEKQWDIGYNSGKKLIIDHMKRIVNQTGFVVTPQSQAECTTMIENTDNPLMAVMIYMNFLYQELEGLDE